MKEKQFKQKIIKDAEDAIIDFILGYIALTIISIPAIIVYYM